MHSWEIRWSKKLVTECICLWWQYTDKEQKQNHSVLSCERRNLYRTRGQIIRKVNVKS